MTAAEIKAHEDWNAHSVCVFTLNDINAKYALIDASGFYIRVHNSADFIRDYNRSIKGFLEKFGIPEWAPIRRIPSLDFAAPFRTLAKPIDELRMKHRQYSRFVDSMKKHWTLRNSGEPISYCELPERKVTLVFGENKYKRIDAIDDIEKVWVGPLPIQTHDYIASH